MANNLLPRHPPGREMLYQSICDQLRNPVLVVDSSYRCVYANQAYLDLLGLPVAQVLNQPIKEVEGAGAFSLIKPRLDHCFAGERVAGKTRVYSNDELHASLNVSLTPYDTDGKGAITHALVIMHMSGCYAPAECEVIANHSQLLKAFESSPQPVFITALQTGEILAVNYAATQLLGYGRDELIGNRLANYMLDPSYRSQLIETLKRQGQLIRSDQLRRKDGSIVNLEVALSSLTFNNTPAILALTRDRSHELLALQATRDRNDTLDLLHTIAVAANEATDIRSALQACLETICQFSGWPIGHALLLNQKAQALETSDIWFSSLDRTAPAWQELSDRRRFAWGEGLPGKVCQSGDVISVADIAESALFPTTQGKGYQAIKSAFAFPVFVKNRVAAVLEFFSPIPRDIPPRLAGTLKPVGVQLGRIIERDHAEQALRASSDYYQRLLNDIDVIVWEAELPGLRFSFVSASAEKKLGYPREAWYQVDFLHHHIHPKDREQVLGLCHGHLQAPTDYELEYRMTAKDGTILWFRNVITVVSDRHNKPSKLRGVMIDVSTHKRLSEKLSYQASHDNLTGLYNREAFECRLNELLNGNPGEYQHAFCYIDLDQFKVINDSCGHLAGDLLLRQLSDLLKTHLRDKDTLARLGGDEFGILLEDCALDQAFKTAEKIHKLIKDFRFIW